MKDRKRVGSNGRGGGKILKGVERGDTTIRIYQLGGKKTIFNKRKKKKRETSGVWRK